MIDVCFSRTASGILKFLRKDIDSEAVFHLGGYFDTRDISENAQEHYAKEDAETLRYFYKDISKEEITDAYKDELKQIHTRYTKFKKHFQKSGAFSFAQFNYRLPLPFCSSPKLPRTAVCVSDIIAKRNLSDLYIIVQPRRLISFSIHAH